LWRCRSNHADQLLDHGDHELGLPQHDRVAAVLGHALLTGGRQPSDRNLAERKALDAELARLPLVTFVKPWQGQF
jgi:hypothetical protein